MKRKSVSLPKADADVVSITHYIYERSPQGAAAWLNAYDQARLRLEAHADIYPRCDENDLFDIDVSQLLFKTRHGRVYRILFTIVADEVRILRVRGPGQAQVTPEELSER